MMSMAGLLQKRGVAGVWITACLIGLINPAHAIERQFLGIRMLSKVQTVLARFGNPTQVTVGQVAYNLPGAQAGMAGGPMMGAPTTGTPGLPGLPGGIGAPARPGMPGMPGYGAMGGAPAGLGLPSVGLRTTPGGMLYEQETTLIYERPGGVIYEFLINKDGYVVQAKAIGYEDKSGLARTSRGIKLGDTYQKVVAVYGWPKEHQNMGATLYVRYPNHHVGFQFYDNKVVSIIVAAMEE
ncbi:MAG: hypothetical protein C4335_13295 [Armatimonadota bacterium]